MTLSCGICWCPNRGPIGLTIERGGGSKALATRIKPLPAKSLEKAARIERSAIRGQPRGHARHSMGFASLSCALKLAGAPPQRAVCNVGNTKTAQSLCLRRHSVRADQLHRGWRGKLSAVGKRPLCAELDSLMGDLMGGDAAGCAVRRSGDPVAFTRAQPRRVNQ